MKREIAQRWVQALRSKKFTQAHGRLHRVHPDSWGKAGYCCLGVLCELAREDGVVEADVHNVPGAYGTYGTTDDFSNNWSTVGLPKAVMDWSGMKSDGGRIGGDGSLAGLNDTGKNFEEIADVIEREVERL